RSMERLGFAVFQPRVRDLSAPTSNRRSAPRPLFRGYLFAHFPADECLEMVRFAHGVAYVVSSGRIPVPVADEVIAELKTRLDQDGYFCLRPPRFVPGERVLIEHGPFAGMVGEVEREWDDGRRVAIFVEAMERARLLLERSALARA